MLFNYFEIQFASLVCTDIEEIVKYNCHCRPCALSIEHASGPAYPLAQFAFKKRENETDMLDSFLHSF